MAEQQKPGASAGRAFLYMLIGLVLWALVALFVRNNDYFIDRFGIYMDWKVGLALAAAGFIGAMFWVQGHRVYAVSKGQSALIGLALAFIPILGLLVLLVVPSRSKPAASAAPEAQGS
ncbi:MAG: hypothetical protein ACE149_05885 [Armatimonadota bacterium]